MLYIGSQMLFVSCMFFRFSLSCYKRAKLRYEYCKQETCYQAIINSEELYATIVGTARNLHGKRFAARASAYAIVASSTLLLQGKLILPMALAFAEFTICRTLFIPNRNLENPSNNCESAL